MDDNGQQRQRQTDQSNHNHAVRFAPQMHNEDDYVNDIDEIIAENNGRDSIYLDPDTVLRLTRSRTSGETTAYRGTRTTTPSSSMTRDTTASTFASPSSKLTATPSVSGVEKKKKASIPGAYPSNRHACQEKILRNSAPPPPRVEGNDPTTIPATAAEIENDNDRAIQLEKQMILQLTRAYTNEYAATATATPSSLLVTPSTMGPPTVRGESSIPTVVSPTTSTRRSNRRPSNGLTSRLSSVQFSSDTNTHNHHHESNRQERHAQAPVLEDYQSGVIIEPPPVQYAGGGGGVGRQISDLEVEEPSSLSLNYQNTQQYQQQQEGCSNNNEIQAISSSGDAIRNGESFQPNNTAGSPDSTNDSSIAKFLRRRSRVAVLVASMCCLVFVGLIITLVIVLVKDPNNDEIVSQTIATNLDLLVGNPLDGATAAGQGMFGSSISMNRNGTRMVVADSSNVYVYEFIDAKTDDTTASSDWMLITAIEGNDESGIGQPESRNELIRSTIQVDISSDGNTIAIGWPYSTNTDGLEPGTGRVEVYQEAELISGITDWKQVGKTLYGQMEKEYFGTSVALNDDGTQVAIGSSGMGDSGNGGSAAIYTLLNQGLWLRKGDTLHLSGNLPIASVAFKGYTLAIAGLQSTTATTTYGQEPVSHVYRFGNLKWVELGKGFSGNRVATAHLTTYQVDMSSNGNIVALSEFHASHQENGNDDLGGVRVFAWDGRDWIQMGEDIVAPGKRSGQYFICMGDDGKLLGLGHPGGDGVVGLTHTNRFDDATQSWKHVGPNYEGEDPGDDFGYAVSLSGDGKSFAAGAPFNGGTDTELGRVYVVDITNLEDVES